MLALLRDCTLHLHDLDKTQPLHIREEGNAVAEVGLSLLQIDPDRSALSYSLFLDS